MSKRDIPLEDKLAYYLLKDVSKAIRDYHMIVDGDRIAVAVSGGRDSLTLLHLLRLRQQYTCDSYQTVAVHVALPKSDGTACTQLDARDVLEPYFQAQGQEYAFEIMDGDLQPNCFRCSHLRRKAVFTAAQRLGCNKVAFAHHADDAAQTTMLNLLFHGKVETLSPTRQFFAGQFMLIRPMIYVQEKEIARFASVCTFPLVPSRCPHSAASRRMLVRDMIRTLEHQYPKVKINLFRAGLRHPSAAHESVATEWLTKRGQ